MNKIEVEGKKREKEKMFEKDGFEDSKLVEEKKQKRTKKKIKPRSIHVEIF